jgi:glycosyltransferase involved in cell wall biosynthesis
MMKIALIAAHAPSLSSFRGELIRRLCSARCAVLALAGPTDSEVSTAISDMGCKFIAYPVQRNGLSPLADSRTLLSLWKLLRQHKPDVVLAYTIKPVIWGGLALWFVRKPRFFALITGLGYAFQPAKGRGMVTFMASWLYRLSLLRAEKVIFQNEDNLNEFVNRRIVPSHKCERVFGSGVDLSHYAMRPLTAGAPVFLGIGRLLGDKGLREFAQAAEIVKAKYPSARLQWLGGVDPSPDGIALADVQTWQELGILEYLGETRDVRAYLAACHVFVLPSYHEGLPRSTLEAMAMGRPVLTTDVPGCRDTVNQNVNGFLVPRADAEALAERIIWFIEHPECWQTMGEASRRIAEERFDVHKVNDEMLKIIGLTTNA